MTGFVAGGPVPLDSPAYVDRPFVEECFTWLTSENWVLLLGPRQHGKSSALARLNRTLLEAGYSVAWIDLQSYAAVGDDYPSLLGWFARRLAIGWGTTVVEPGLDNLNDLEAWLSAAAPPGGGALALFIDEAASLPERWRVQFYSQLRALFNARAHAGQEAIPRRLVVLFTGTFRPELLIRIGTNSPFNISKDVRPEDLTRDEALSLAIQVTGSDLQPWTSRAHALVGGQPFLLQYILSRVAAGTSDNERERAYDSAVGRLRAGRDRHFTSLFEQVLAEPALSELVVRIAESRDGIPLLPANKNHAFLDVLGVATAADGRLQIRNELYREFALSDPALRPSAPPGAHQALLRRSEDLFDVVLEPRLRALAYEAYDAAISAYNSGHLRLALAGFGSSLEATLLDYLLGLVEADLEAARTSLEHPPTPAGRPEKWDLAELVDVCHATSRFQGVANASPHALRTWRNQIHPGRALADYKAEADLDPEVRMGPLVIEIVIRTIRPATGGRGAAE